VEDEEASLCEWQMCQDEEVKIPGRLVNYIKGCNNLFKVIVKIGNKTKLAILDTGAEFSLMTTDTAKDLELSVVAQQCLFRVAAKEMLSSYGTTVASVNIEGVKLDDIFFQVYEASQDILVLGRDCIWENKLEICPSRNLLIKHLPEGASC